jgi:hypothetical protein
MLVVEFRWRNPGCLITALSARHRRPPFSGRQTGSPEPMRGWVSWFPEESFPQSVRFGNDSWHIVAMVDSPVRELGHARIGLGKAIRPSKVGG